MMLPRASHLSLSLAFLPLLASVANAKSSPAPHSPPPTTPQQRSSDGEEKEKTDPPSDPAGSANVHSAVANGEQHASPIKPGVQAGAEEACGVGDSTGVPEHLLLGIEFEGMLRLGRD